MNCGDKFPLWLRLEGRTGSGFNVSPVCSWWRESSAMPPRSMEKALLPLPHSIHARDIPCTEIPLTREGSSCGNTPRETQS